MKVSLVKLLLSDGSHDFPLPWLFEKTPELRTVRREVKGNGNDLNKDREITEQVRERERDRDLAEDGADSGLEEKENACGRNSYICIYKPTHEYV